MTTKPIPNVLKTTADAQLVTRAIARYARRHNEYASTVRQNTDLRAAAIKEWNAMRVAGREPALKKSA